jgi:hypothetical protein
MTGGTAVWQAGDCHEVVPLLEQVAARSRALNDPVGYFAMLYRLTTLKIVRAVDEGRFEDNPRMAEMDKNFANRYLDAVFAHFDGRPATAVWEASFRGAVMPDLIVLQHLFLAMNAHINFDLAVAAAATCPGDSILSFANDFSRINGILHSLFDIVEHDVAKVWHPLRILLPLGERLGNLLLAFDMNEERHASWGHAVELALLEPEARAGRIGELDRHYAALARHIIDPGPLLRPVLAEIRGQERGSVADKIEDFDEQVASDEPAPETATGQRL